MRALIVALALAPLALLAGCGDGGSPDAAPTAAPNSVKAVAAPEGTSWVDTVTKTDRGVLMGNPDAPLKIVEYGSRACPACAMFDIQGFDPLTQKYIATGKVSYEFRDYPIHGAMDLAPILLGKCVDDAAFFPLLNQMFHSQSELLANAQQAGTEIQNMPGLSPAQTATAFAEKLGYLDFVKQRGVPDAKARACLNDKAALDKLTADTEYANTTYGIHQTPSFVLNGKLLDNVGSWAQLEEVLKKAGA